MQQTTQTYTTEYKKNPVFLLSMLNYLLNTLNISCSQVLDI